MNEPRRRGPIARLAIGIWDTVNFTRRLVFNLLFLLVLVVVLAAMFGGGKLAPLSDICFRVPSTETPRIQEGHEFIGHLLCALVEAEMHPREAN